MTDDTRDDDCNCHCPPTVGIRFQIQQSLLSNNRTEINISKSGSMEYRKYFFHFCGLALSTVLVYLFFTNKHIILIQSLDISSPRSFPTTNDSLSSSSSLQSANNSTNNSASEQLRTSTLPPPKPFEPHISEHHPRLPIHIYTQNLTLPGNTSKLILLGNGFFGDRQWGIAGAGKSSTAIMTGLLCPFFADRCDITDNMDRFSQADAVVYHMRDNVDKRFAKKKRRPEQRFVFALWESPRHTPDLQSFAGFFNWTMTFRFNSHIITSYYSGNSYTHIESEFYRIMMHENITRNLNIKITKGNDRPSDSILAEKKLGTAAALVSNCGGSSNRMPYIQRLQRYLDVKIYGRCGETCPANVNCREFIAKNYYFILSFENSLCSDYTTEKFFSSLEYPIVPVVLGRSNYSYFIPTSGFIDVRNFAKISLLAQFLNATRHDKEKYLSYFAWKKDYVWGLNTFFTPFCDLCLRLHLDSTPNTINDIHSLWFSNTCEAPRPPV